MLRVAHRSADRKRQSSDNCRRNSHGNTGRDQVYKVRRPEQVGRVEHRQANYIGSHFQEPEVAHQRRQLRLREVH